MSIDRRRSRPGKVAFATSATLHVVARLVLWLSREVVSPLPEFLVYQFALVEPPPAEAAEEMNVPPPPEQPVVDRPEPEPEPVTEVPPPPQPTRRPPPPPDTRRAEPEEPPREPEPARGPNPEAGRKDAGSGLTVKMEGLRTDYPDYFQNIVRQLTRYFRWRGRGNWEAEVAFMIRKDGEVVDVEWVRRSGNIPFDLDAMGAVESAGRDRAFGPLPEGFPADYLPVSFYFSPLGFPRCLATR